MVTAGSVINIKLNNAARALIEFNDIYITGTSLDFGRLLRLLVHAQRL